MKAILIDVYNKNITVVEQSGFKDIYLHIGCTCFNCISVDALNALYVDDEGLLKSKRHAFKIENFESPIMGNGLICGFDIESGDSIDTTLTVEEVTPCITFVEYDNAPEVVL